MKADMLKPVYETLEALDEEFRRYFWISGRNYRDDTNAHFWTVTFSGRSAHFTVGRDELAGWLKKGKKSLQDIKAEIWTRAHKALEEVHWTTDPSRNAQLVQDTKQLLDRIAQDLKLAFPDSHGPEHHVHQPDIRVWYMGIKMVVDMKELEAMIKEGRSWSYVRLWVARRLHDMTADMAGNYIAHVRKTLTA